MAVVKLKRNGTASAVPNPLALELGEVVINTADGFMWFKDNGDNLIKVLTGKNNVTDLADGANYAPKASPAFTGTPTAPTPTAGDGTTKIATTEFVDTSFAKKASPAFTGIPTAPTAAASTDTTQVATTAFVQQELAGFTVSAEVVNSWTFNIPYLSGKLLNVSGATNGYPASMSFSADGTKVYITDATYDSIKQYDLSVAWDISTAVAGVIKSVAAQDNIPVGFEFKPDGTKMFLLGTQGDKIYEYTLSTPWDVSTLTYTGVTFYSGSNYTDEIIVSPDGLKIYVIYNSTLYVRTMSTAWDLSTAVDSGTISLSSIGANITDIFFHPGGSIAFMYNGGTDDRIYKVNLSVPNDLNSTLTVEDRSYYIGSYEDSGVSIHFSSDGGKLFTVGLSGDSIEQVELV